MAGCLAAWLEHFYKKTAKKIRGVEHLHHQNTPQETTNTTTNPSYANPFLITQTTTKSKAAAEEEKTAAGTYRKLRRKPIWNRNTSLNLLPGTPIYTSVCVHLRLRNAHCSRQPCSTSPRCRLVAKPHQKKLRRPPPRQLHWKLPYTTTAVPAIPGTIQRRNLSQHPHVITQKRRANTCVWAYKLYARLKI